LERCDTFSINDRSDHCCLYVFYRLNFLMVNGELVSTIIIHH